MNSKAMPVSELIETLAEGITSADIKKSDILSSISMRIIDERMKRGMGQKQFAQYIGVTQGMVSKWENGDYNFTIDTITKIFDKLNVSIDIIFDKSNLNKFKDNDDQYYNYYPCSQKEEWEVLVGYGDSERLALGA